MTGNSGRKKERKNGMDSRHDLSRSSAHTKNRQKVGNGNWRNWLIEAVVDSFQQNDTFAERRGRVEWNLSGQMSCCTPSTAMRQYLQDVSIFHMCVTSM